jgi:hypothetical protein
MYLSRQQRVLVSIYGEEDQDPLAINAHCLSLCYLVIRTVRQARARAVHQQRRHEARHELSDTLFLNGGARNVAKRVPAVRCEAEAAVPVWCVKGPSDV